MPKAIRAAIQSLRRLYGLSWEVWILVLGHLSAGLFVANLTAGINDISEPRLKAFTITLSHLHHHATQGAFPLQRFVLILVVLLLIQLCRGRSVRLGCDLLGILLSVRCLMQFLIMNLLLLAPLAQGGLLLVELILFLPVVTLNFGWLYWRLDLVGRQNGKPQIRFEEEPPMVFDYFHISANALLQFDPSGAKPLSKRMKTLFTSHGIVMMDLVALTLSRAIGLASSG